MDSLTMKKQTPLHLAATVGKIEVQFGASYIFSKYFVVWQISQILGVPSLARVGGLA